METFHLHVTQYAPCNFNMLNWPSLWPALCSKEMQPPASSNLQAKLKAPNHAKSVHQCHRSPLQSSNKAVASYSVVVFGDTAPAPSSWMLHEREHHELWPRHGSGNSGGCSCRRRVLVPNRRSRLAVTVRQLRSPSSVPVPQTRLRFPKLGSGSPNSAPAPNSARPLRLVLAPQGGSRPTNSCTQGLFAPPNIGTSPRDFNGFANREIFLETKTLAHSITGAITISFGWPCFCTKG